MGNSAYAVFPSSLRWALHMFIRFRSKLSATGQKPPKRVSLSHVRSTSMNGPWIGIGLLLRPMRTKFDSGEDGLNCSWVSGSIHKGVCHDRERRSHKRFCSPNSRPSACFAAPTSCMDVVAVSVYRSKAKSSKILTNAIVIFKMADNFTRRRYGGPIYDYVQNG